MIWQGERPRRVRFRGIDHCKTGGEAGLCDDVEGIGKHPSICSISVQVRRSPFQLRAVLDRNRRDGHRMPRPVATDRAARSCRPPSPIGELERTSQERSRPVRHRLVDGQDESAAPGATSVGGSERPAPGWTSQCHQHVIISNQCQQALYRWPYRSAGNASEYPQKLRSGGMCPTAR
jgi:hypothetical protein